MTLFTLGARNLLKRQIYQLPNTTNWTLSKTLPFFSLQLIQNIHPPSLHKTTPNLYAKSKTLQFPARSLSSSSPAMISRDSKRTPWMPFYNNEADVIEQNMLDDGFRTWGLVIYRCTYKSNSDWEEFVSRFLHQVWSTLKDHDGLDMLDSFMPTVMDDKTQFDGVTPYTVRDHFNKWASTACEAEQGVPFTLAQWSNTARYGLCIMVEEEALQSVLDIPLEELDTYNETGFVILVNGRQEAERGEEESDELVEDDFEPLHGCTLEDVGWMKVRYGQAQIMGSAHMGNGFCWEREYRRPPQIG